MFFLNNLEIRRLIKKYDPIDKISKFLDLYENIEHAKLIFNRYIAAQNNFPEYATIESIKNLIRK